MINLIFNLVVIFAVVVAVFFETRKLVMMWTGSTKEEATKKIQAFISQKEEYHLATDQMLITDIENAINDIVGDARYTELCRLARTSQMIGMNYASGLPYIAVTVNYADENEKYRLENILADLVSKYLGIFLQPSPAPASPPTQDSGGKTLATELSWSMTISLFYG